jgi:hypothetical protein
LYIEGFIFRTPNYGGGGIQLEKVKEQILSDLMDNTRIDEARYDLSDTNERLRRSELAMHLLQMKRDGLVSFVESKSMVSGGKRTKYNNSILMIYSEDIILEPKGKDYFESLRVSKTTKVSRIGKSFIKDLFKETRTQVIKSIALALVALLLVIVGYFKFF